MEIKSSFSFFLFSQRVQYWNRAQHGQYSTLLTNQIADILYVSDNALLLNNENVETLKCSNNDIYFQHCGYVTLIFFLNV